MFPGRQIPPMQGFPMQNPFGGGFQPQQMASRGAGGLLKRLFSGASSSPMQGVANPSAAQGMFNPSTIQGLANPANLSGMLGNVQKALKMAETVGPMVQQYGPLVRNIPAMYKIYKELNNNDSETVNAEEGKDVEASIRKKEVKEREVPKEKEATTTKRKSTEQKASLPKLYV
ncbi:hypothetical protein IMZ08_08050 [Bacillus luteolus]|uniref:YqfQ-like protein n=1 Tax=Litchfieldia luteola TaxID=682179 RepID=A0ABR9QHM7_9BACI|nr:VrrA/YqfQ family protein [Cytobacillus luteolus]MBE4908002.1 hypothetical protein [Cytobacillus luteolus]MBP1942785.1 hypothetical protein [Cytobacillus luteolus]